MPIEVCLEKDEFRLSDEVEGFLRKEVKPHGNGAHVTVPKEHVGKTVYVVVCKE